MAKGYLIVEIDTVDPELMVRYREKTPDAIAAFGGRFIVRGGASQTLEGDWKPPRIVVIEFPSVAKAREFYGSDLYKPLLEMRLRAGRSKAVLVEGVAE